jgi:hypothetical protein
MRPFSTVVIPTRARADVLEHTLRSVTAPDDDALEILVRDTADCRPTAWSYDTL